jgi:hypothetical protein
MPKAVARKHHYVPQMYLSGFAGANGQCFAVDASTRKTFTSSPANIAAERDFNKVEAEGVPPDALEKELGNFEGVIAPGIKRVRETASFGVELIPPHCTEVLENEALPRLPSANLFVAILLIDLVCLVPAWRRNHVVPCGRDHRATGVPSRVRNGTQVPDFAAGSVEAIKMRGCKSRFVSYRVATYSS